MSKKVRNIKNKKETAKEYAITYMPITDGPRYDHPDIKSIAMRKIGTTKQLCYLVNVPTEFVSFVPAYDKKLSDQSLRDNRCEVTSDKTGKAIVCDHHKSCYGCPHAGKFDVQTRNNASVEYLYEQGVEIATYDRTSDAGMANLTVQELISELRRKDKKLYDICLLFLHGYNNKEVMEELHIKKSTFYDEIKRMRKVAEKYI